MSNKVHIEALIKGVVQGVGYRWFATRTASKYNVSGYVANLPTGDVKAVIEGEQGMVNDFIDELKVGPPSASVNDIIIDKGEYTGKYRGFGVEYA
ncbi:MAG: acylphosphatase [candidate division Zixibacteria bacterium]|nr:acylphosphatase [candidate division Zixibacteria bacterium]